jgi:hypothetical protein
VKRRVSNISVISHSRVMVVFFFFFLFLRVVSEGLALSVSIPRNYSF